MGIINRTAGIILRWWKSLFSAKDIESVFETKIATSPEEIELRDTWRAAVMGDLPHNRHVPSMFRAALISSKVSKIVTLEEEVTVSGSDVADFINDIFAHFRNDLTNGLRSGVEKCCRGGTVLLLAKPIEDRIDLVIYENNEYFSLGYSDRGDLIDVVVPYSIEDGKTYYTLIGRYRYYKNEQQIHVTYKAFESADAHKLGHEIRLTSVDMWVGLSPDMIYNGQEESWFIEVSMPSKEAIFSKAIDLFRKLDEHKASEEAEFNNAKSKKIIPVEMTRYNAGTGKLEFDNSTQEYIFHDSDDHTISFYNPNIRNQNYAEGANQIERDIEKACEIAYGTISESAQQAKTATEILSSKDVTFTTISDIQKIWEATLRKMAVAIRSISITFFGYRYGELEFVFKWNDGVPVDEKEELEATKGTAALLQVNQDIITQQERRAYLLKRLPDVSTLTDEELAKASERLPMVQEEGGNI